MAAQSNLEATSDSPPPAPPLSVRHFLYWTAGVAVCLGHYYGNEPPKPRNLVGYLLVASSVTYCIVAGGAIAFLIWSLAQRLFRRPVPLSQPGAKYAAILGVTMAIALAKMKALGWLWTILVDDPYSEQIDDFFWWQNFSDMASESLTAIIFACGIFWIRGLYWKTGLIALLLLSIHSAYTSYTLLDLQPVNRGSALRNSIEENCLFVLNSVPFLAAIISLVVDGRSNIKRDWTHYFGVLLCGLRLIEYLLIPFNR